jgi:photosystem II stability/assembly factor-like uncharacterized protein
MALRSLILTVSLFILVGIFYIYLPIEVKKENSFQKIPKEAGIEALAEQEFEMTKDPLLGIVPKHRLYKTARTIDQFKKDRGIDLYWEERGPSNFAGRVRAILFDAKDPSGNTIWAGGIAGGLWKCSNAFSAPSWVSVPGFTGNVAVSSLVQDPNDLNTYFLGTGEGFYNADAYRGDGIYKSTDGGENWERLTSTNNVSFQYIQKLLFANGRLYACTRDEGVMVSDDGGESWVKSLGNGSFGFSDRASDIEVSTDGTLYASMGLFTEDGVYKSTDNGDSWTYLPFPFSSYERVEITTAPSNPDVIYALPQETKKDSVRYIMKSTDAGNTWDTLAPPGAHQMKNFARNQAWYDLSLGVDPNDENRVFIGGIDLLVSDDGGQNWTQISQWYGAQNYQYVHADQHNMAFLPSDPNKMMFSNDGGIWLTENSTAAIPTINNINDGLNITQFYSCAVHPDPTSDWIIAGTQDNGTHLFTQEGINATDRITGGDGAYCFIDKDNPNIQISSYVYSAYWVSLDGWGSNTYYKTDSTKGYFINPTDYDDVHDKLYCSSNGGSISSLDIYTGVFDSIHLDGIGNSRATAIKVNPYNADEVYIGTNNGNIYRVENLLTEPIVTLSYNGNGNVRSIEFGHENEMEMIASYSNYGVISVVRSSDGGTNWEPIEGNLPDIPVRWAMFNPINADGAILGTELGVWTTDNIDGQNTSWSLNAENLPLTRVDMLDLREADDLLIAATHGRGVYTTSSLQGLNVYFNVSNYEITDGFGNMVNDQCPRYFVDSVSVKLSTPFAADISFEISVLPDGTAVPFIDFELVTTELNIPEGETEAWLYFKVYENMVVKGPRYFELLAENTAFGFLDQAKITILDDELSTEDLFTFVRQQATDGLSSVLTASDTAIYSTQDSLVFSIYSDAGNVEDCFVADILYSGNELLSSDDYICSNKVFYLSNEEAGNTYTCIALLDDVDRDLLDDIFDSLRVLYIPEKLSAFTNIEWQAFELIEFEDLGWKKNAFKFEYKGPGSYSLGMLNNSSSISNLTNTKVNIYPNPADEFIHLQIGHGHFHSAELFSLQGEKLGSWENLKIDVSRFKAGVYLLKIQLEEGSITEKLILGKP